MSTEPLDFSILDDDERGLRGGVPYDVFELFERALKSSSPSPDIDRTAQLFATSILALFSDPEFQKREVKGFPSDVYGAFAGISTCIPSGHYAQDVLARALPVLEQTAGEKWDMWEFKVEIRSIWNHNPTSEIEFADEDDQRLTLGEWFNLNSFVAKCFENNIPQSFPANAFLNYPLWQLRHALEEPAQDEENKKIIVPQDVIDMRVRVACEWIIKGGKALLAECLRNSCEDHPNGGNQGRPYGPGSLFHGGVGFGLERWGFWKRRIVELKATVGVEVHGSIDEALARMKAVEKEASEAFVPRRAS